MRKEICARGTARIWRLLSAVTSFLEGVLAPPEDGARRLRPFRRRYWIIVLFIQNAKVQKVSQLFFDAFTLFNCSMLSSFSCFSTVFRCFDVFQVSQLFFGVFWMFFSMFSSFSTVFRCFHAFQLFGASKFFNCCSMLSSFSTIVRLFQVIQLFPTDFEFNFTYAKFLNIIFNDFLLFKFCFLNFTNF